MPTPQLNGQQSPENVPDDLPELTSQQVELAIWAAQMALVEDTPTWRLYGNRQGELCVKPIHEGPPKRAK